MDNGNIEELLKQYGEDRRQQEAVVERVHHLRRRQRGVLAGVAVLVLLGVVSPVLWRGGNVDDAPIVAGIPERVETANGQTEPRPVAPPVDNRSHQRVSVQVKKYTLAGDECLAATLQAVVPAVEPEQPSPEKGQAMSSMAEAVLVPQFALRDGAEPGKAMVSEDRSRWSLVPSIGASMSTGTMDYLSIINSNLSMAVDADLTLVSGSRYEVGLGIGVEGMLNGSVVDVSDGRMVSNDALNGMESFFASAMDMCSEEKVGVFYDPTLCVYLRLPISFRLYPGGKSRRGWQFSLVPASNLTAGQSLSIVNKWKMTVGVSVLLPQGTVRRVGITANVLPTYIGGQMKQVHEVGLELSF